MKDPEEWQSADKGILLVETSSVSLVANSSADFPYSTRLPGVGKYRVIKKSLCI
jgi:hypothetical protein